MRAKLVEANGFMMIVDAEWDLTSLFGEHRVIMEGLTTEMDACFRPMFPGSLLDKAILRKLSELSYSDAECIMEFFTTHDVGVKMHSNGTINSVDVLEATPISVGSPTPGQVAFMSAVYAILNDHLLLKMLASLGLKQVSR